MGRYSNHVRALWANQRGTVIIAARLLRSARVETKYLLFYIMIGNLSESAKKLIKLSFITAMLLFSYIYLFAVGAKDHEFLLAGGSIGFASSVIEFFSSSSHFITCLTYDIAIVCIL